LLPEVEKVLKFLVVRKWVDSVAVERLHEFLLVLLVDKFVYLVFRELCYSSEDGFAVSLVVAVLGQNFFANGAEWRHGIGSAVQEPHF